MNSSSILVILGLRRIIFNRNGSNSMGFDVRGLLSKPAYIKIHFCYWNQQDLIFSKNLLKYYLRLQIFPVNIKGVAGSVATLTNWFGSWLCSYTFNFLISWSSYGKYSDLFQLRVQCSLIVEYIEVHETYRTNEFTCVYDLQVPSFFMQELMHSLYYL